MDGFYAVTCCPHYSALQQGGSVSGRAGSGVFPMRVLRFSLPVSIFLSCRACRFADFIFFWRVDRVGRVRRVCCLPVSYVSLRSLGRVPLRSQGEVSLRSLLICSKSSHIPPSPDMSRHGGDMCRVGVKGFCAACRACRVSAVSAKKSCRACRPKVRFDRVGDIVSAWRPVRFFLCVDRFACHVRGGSHVEALRFVPRRRHPE